MNATALPEVLLLGENPPPEVDPVEVNDQVTPWFPESFVSVAVTESVWDVVRLPRAGLTDTVMPAPPELVVAEAVLE